MSGLYKSFKTDNKKENEGIEVEFPENDDKTIPTFTIARTGESNSAYTKALEAATKPYRRQIQLNTLSEAKSKSLYMNVFIETILKGWKNVQDRKGNLIEFTKVNAINLFTELPDLYNDLAQQSSNLALFRDDALDNEAKN